LRGGGQDTLIEVFEEQAQLASQLERTTIINDTCTQREPIEVGE
jgi:hypothetical protein